MDDSTGRPETVSIPNIFGQPTPKAGIMKSVLQTKVVHLPVLIADCTFLHHKQTTEKKKSIVLSWGQIIIYFFPLCAADRVKLCLLSGKYLFVWIKKKIPDPSHLNKKKLLRIKIISSGAPFFFLTVKTYVFLVCRNAELTVWTVHETPCGLLPPTPNKKYNLKSMSFPTKQKDVFKMERLGT